MNVLQKNQLSLLLISILVVIKFLLVPWLDWVSEKTAAISHLATSQQRFENVGERHEALVNKKQQIEQSFQQLDKIWASGDSAQNSVAVLRYIESAAQKYNIELQNRSAQDAVIADTTTIPGKLFIEGAPDALVLFIKDLETGSPRVLVRKMSINRLNKKSKSLVMNLEVLIVAKPGQQNETAK